MRDDVPLGPADPSPYNYRLSLPMISIEMDISALALGQAFKPDGPPQASSCSDSGFALTLKAVQAGAPPGSGPPPTGQKVGEEVANLELTAPTLNPDFLPTPKGDTPTTTSNPASTVRPRKLGEVKLAACVVDPGLLLAAFQTPPAVPTTPVAAQLSPAPSSNIATAVATVPSAEHILPTVGSTEPECPPLPPVAEPTLPSAPTTSNLQEPLEVEDQEVTVAAEAPGIDLPKPLVSSGTKPVDKARPAPDAKPEVGGRSTQSAGSTITISAKNDSNSSANDSFDSSDEAQDDPVVEGPSQVEPSEAKPIFAKLTPDRIEQARGPEPQTGTHPLAPRQINLVVRQIADRMELLAATRPKAGVTIMLQPAHLGSITMTVKSLAGSIEAHISASNDDVRAALEQNRSLLGTAMEQRGLKLDAVSIAPQTQTSTQREPQQQAQAQHRQPQTQQPLLGTVSQSAVVDSASHRTTVRSSNGVDIWI